MTTSVRGGGGGAGFCPGVEREGSRARPHLSERLDGVREGGRAAALYASYRSVVESRCRRLLATPAAAEDAVQEVFVKIIAHLGEIPDGDGTVRWLCRVATNHCLNELRNEKHRRAAIAPVVPDVPSPCADVEQRELAVRVLAQVPAEVRVIAWLNHVDQVDQREIAALLGISRRTVVARLSTFRARAQRVLANLRERERQRR
ncbi:MAG TPA: sigma-70 family RNA polymerase sigma factor [Polyangiaceae bacterium]